MIAKSAGNSKKPLAKKLGIVPNSRVVTKFAPADYVRLLQPMPDNVQFQPAISSNTDIVHLFTTHKAVLNAELKALRHLVKPDCAVWVSWPKKDSKVPTDITDQAIRELALPLGFVEVKACAVDYVWSGMKLVVRKELR